MSFIKDGLLLKTGNLSEPSNALSFLTDFHKGEIKFDVFHLN